MEDAFKGGIMNFFGTLKGSDFSDHLHPAHCFCSWCVSVVLKYLFFPVALVVILTCHCIPAIRRVVEGGGGFFLEANCLPFWKENFAWMALAQGMFTAIEEPA